mmetsp:Transcript_57783/g.70637  ORF Transcript_57783/g.70637 Transcript_57783/m.70637 type:complete len:312 (-) Transcript_57783:65-1000(-)
MEVELRFLNGKSFMVDLSQGLQAAKVKAAEVLGTPAEAVSINLGQQVLTQDVVSKWQTEETPLEACYVVVDQDRLALAKALETFEEDLENLKIQSLVVSRLKAAWELKKRELPCLEVEDCKRCIKAAERSLKEDVLSVRQEKALVSKISKLQRLTGEEQKFFEERRRLGGLHFNCEKRMLAEKKKLRKDLGSEMQDILCQRIDTNMPVDGYVHYFSKGWIDKYIIQPELALGSFDDETLRQVCPRFDRRNLWSPKHAKQKKVAPRCATQSCTTSDNPGEVKTQRLISKKRKDCRKGQRLNHIRHDLDLELI